MASGKADAELARLLRKYEAAQRGWNNDPGPIERTVMAGENLFFAADELIRYLMGEDLV